MLTVLLAVARQAPLAGLVWQIEIASGKVVLPVSALTVIVSEAPRLTVATAKALLPLALGIVTSPLAVGVAVDARIDLLGREQVGLGY